MFEFNFVDWELYEQQYEEMENCKEEENND